MDSSNLSLIPRTSHFFLIGRPLKSTKQTVIDLKTWRLSVPSCKPLTFEKLVQQNKLQENSPGLPDKHFKSKMKPISLKEKELFLSKFNFKPKHTTKAKNSVQTAKCESN